MIFHFQNVLHQNCTNCSWAPFGEYLQCNSCGLEVKWSEQPHSIGVVGQLGKQTSDVGNGGEWCGELFVKSGVGSGVVWGVVWCGSGVGNCVGCGVVWGVVCEWCEVLWAVLMSAYLVLQKLGHHFEMLQRCLYFQINQTTVSCWAVSTMHSCLRMLLACLLGKYSVIFMEYNCQ